MYEVCNLFVTMCGYKLITSVCLRFVNVCLCDPAKKLFGTVLLENPYGENLLSYDNLLEEVSIFIVVVVEHYVKICFNFDLFLR